MAKIFEVEMTWLYKGRYEKTEKHRVVATNTRAAVGKALGSRAKGNGYRESIGATMKIRCTVITTKLAKEEEDNE